MGMSDRKLLELAAKAAGINHPAGEHCVNGPAVWDIDRLVWWRPLTDDGDALRLAVKLQLTICNEHCSAGVAYCTKGMDDIIYPEVDSGTNEGSVIDEDYVATRRAIVRAAAEIGKAMQEQAK